MKISSFVLKNIGKCVSNLTYETGGILGAKCNDVITELFLDPKTSYVHPCSYLPSVDDFNLQISLWSVENINFKGLFHTHFASVSTLSETDKEYIKIIMKSLPEDVQDLYFPLFVLPEERMVPYYAFRQQGEIIIQKEELEIV